MKPFLFAFISLFAGITAEAQIDTSLFSIKTTFSTGTNSNSLPHTLGSGDIDGDGKIDIVVPNSGSNTVSVFRNINVSGHQFDSTSFAAKMDLTTQTVPMNAMVYDVDNDGKKDVVVAHYGITSISVFPGNSTVGSISFGTRIDITGSTNPSYVVFEDIDGDNKAEMIVTNFGSATVSVFKNTSTTGAISFAAKVDFATGSGPAILKTSDINGDGKRDIVLTNYNGNSFSVLKNKTLTGGAISFDAAKNFNTQSLPNGLDIYDINKDGKPDVALTNSNSSTISVYKNISVTDTIKFGSPVIFNVGTIAQSLIFADMDGDSLKDICVTNRTSNTLSVFKTKSGITTIDTGSFYAKVNFNITGGPLGLVGNDMDNNGSIDLVVTNYATGKITVLTNKMHSTPTTDIAEIVRVSNDELMVYPNSFNNELIIAGIKNEAVEIITLYDLNGKLILTTKDSIIDTRGLAQGVYVIQIKTDKQLYHQKVIKQD